MSNQFETNKIIKTRIREYGNNFPVIAKLFNSFFRIEKIELSRELTEEDVAKLMGVMKISRLMQNPSHRDSLQDLLNYFMIAFDYDNYVKSCIETNNDPSDIEKEEQRWNTLIGTGDGVI